MSPGTTGYVVGDIYLDAYLDLDLSLPIPCILVGVEDGDPRATWFTFLWSDGDVNAAADAGGGIGMVPLGSLS